eukprot:TRINITY_DN14360_c1_g1_i1.p1 TRINITY_DN14360_c1_g1~~TRINITY_DN14360_c1_g1_i1.p1  ORF type:complete len:346 (-),score=51.97 TRINITY_DN14360_c1_g1_i1:14-1051(-)
MDKTLEQLEEERLQRIIAKKKGNAPQAQATPPPQSHSAPKPAPASNAAAPKQWKYQQKTDNAPAPAPGLTGPVMDLSTRVNYLNSLLDQGTIDEAEYQRRADVLQNIGKIVDAVQSGDARQLEALLNEHPSIDLNHIQEGGATIVNIAVESIIRGTGGHKILELLCTRGAAADPVSNGFTPLLTLCQYPSKVRDLADCLKVLISNGASVTRAVTATKSNNQTRFALDYLLNGGAPLDAIQVLCSHGADPNTPSEQGSVLNFCCIQGYTEEARVLLAHKANPNARVPGIGANCLASAINDNNYNLVKLLLEHGADKNAPVITSVGNDNSITLAKALKLSNIEQLLQ